MTFKQSLRNKFGHRVQASRASRRGRNPVKLRLEILENRLAPTVSLSYDGFGTLTMAAANSTSAPVTIEVVNPSTIETFGDTMSFGSTTPTGFTLIPFAGTGSLLTVPTATLTNLTISGPNGTTDTADTVDLTAFISLSGGHLSVSAKTVNFTAGGTVDASLSVSVSATTISIGAGAVVESYSASLTSVNSLQFQSTGVPFLGSVTIHDGPPSGQPFAGDPYITGPDWGSYGYAPGDTINILNAGTLISGTGSGSTPPVYVHCCRHSRGQHVPRFHLQCPIYYIPRHQSVKEPHRCQRAVLWLHSSTPGHRIEPGRYRRGEHDLRRCFRVPQPGRWPQYVVILNATTVGGNITLQDLPSTGATVVLGTLNAGSGTIQLAVNGSVLPNAAIQEFGGIPGQPATGICLTAGAVDLTTTGSSSVIGFPPVDGLAAFPITTQSGVPGQSLELTAATNDGPIYIQDSSPAGLTINSVVADQGGQAPILSDGQIVYNSTPSSSTPTDSPGSDGVTITSPGPIVLNSVSATGDVSISGEYILEGNAQSPNIIAQSVDLLATGTADYQGQVAFADSPSGDTLTLPSGDTWSQFGFTSLAAGDPIIVSGALASADNGAFTIASVSTNGYTLILTQSFVLTPETQAGITVGDGMIGQASAAIALSSVPLFSASTPNGDIYLDAGNGVPSSTAVNVSAGGMNNMANGVSVTSSADFLTIENITATGEAAVAANSGSLIEYNGGTITAQIVSLTSPFNIGTASSPFVTNATSGLSVAATATSPSSAGIYIQNNASSLLTAIGVRTYDGSVTILSAGGALSFDNNQLSETGAAVVTFTNTDEEDGSDGNVVVSGTVFVSSIVAGIGADGTAGAGQILTNPTTSGTIDGGNGTVFLSAGSGIGVSGTPVAIANVATLDATTNTGDINVNNGASSGSPLTLSASTSAGNITVLSKYEDIDLSSEMSSTAGVVLNSISAPGKVTLNAVGGAIVDEFDSTVSANTLVLTAGGGIGSASSPLKTTSRGILTLTASAVNGGLFLDSSTALTVASATAGNGDLSISAAGNLTLLSTVADTGNVTLTATAGALTTGNITTSAAAITTTGQQTVTPAVMEAYITVGATLLIDAGQTDQETVTVTAVTATTFTATFAKTHAANFTISTATTANSISAASVAPISAGSLTITAEQIGSPSDVIQTSATTINATANYGGIYLSNGNSNTLTLTAAAVGTSSSGVAPNNIEIYSAGNIVLLQQTTALTQLATAVPVAVFTPGGVLTLFAGATLSADGGTPTIVNSSATITSTTTPPTATSTVSQGAVATVSFSLGSAGLTTARYMTAPTVTFSGGGGSGATATATINASGQVTGITITNGGSGYTSAPTVTISPPGDDIYTGTYDINGTTAVTSSSPQYLQSLVIISNTAEVVVTPPGGTAVIPALITLADLTTLARETNGNGLVPVANGTETVATINGTTTVTIVASAITIDDLGQNGSAGTAVIPDGWSLVLDATDGSIVFLDLGDTIETTGTGTITVEAGTSTTDVAALGNLTTGGGNITVSAGGNIAVGTLTAGKTAGSLGAVSVTSANGAILFSNATIPTITAGSTTLTEAAQPVSLAQSAALAELNAAEVIAAADAASAQAVAASDAAGAQAAAELASANAFQAALTSIQAAVTTANQTYQTAVQITNQANNTVNADVNQVNALTVQVTNLDIASGSFALGAAVVSEIAAFVGLTLRLLRQDSRCGHSNTRGYGSPRLT